MKDYESELYWYRDNNFNKIEVKAMNILNLFIIKVWDEETHELVEKKGIVMGNNFSEAAAALEDNYEAIEEIIYLSCIGDTTSYEIDDATYSYFVKVKEEMVW